MNRNTLNDTHSLSHTKWNCKYHVVFAPKYRRKVFYEEKRLEVGAILRQLCQWKGVNIIEAEGGKMKLIEDDKVYYDLSDTVDRYAKY